MSPFIHSSKGNSHTTGSESRDKVTNTKNQTDTQWSYLQELPSHLDQISSPFSNSVDGGPRIPCGDERQDTRVRPQPARRRRYAPATRRPQHHAAPGEASRTPPTGCHIDTLLARTSLFARSRSPCRSVAGSRRCSGCSSSVPPAGAAILSAFSTCCGQRPQNTLGVIGMLGRR